jgi:hypothetical protein
LIGHRRRAVSDRHPASIKINSSFRVHGNYLLQGDFEVLPEVIQARIAEPELTVQDRPNK